MPAPNNSAAICPNCGEAIPMGAANALCSRCLLWAALADPTSASTEASEPNSRSIGFGDYELIHEIARGGMGVVWKARQISLERLVALKLVHGGIAAAPEFVQRFRIEAAMAAKLDHPNIVPIYEVGEHDGQPFFSMKLVEGGTLAELIKTGDPCPEPSLAAATRGRLRRQTRGGGLTPMAAAELLGKLARAVHYAHQRGILHRDIKPSNVFIDTKGELYLGDFGLAKLIQSDSTLTQTAVAFGTPSYMSPEQASGKVDAVTTATDVYGLGAVLYAALSGRPPFAKETSAETIRHLVDFDPVPPSRWNSGVDRDLEIICLKCLEKDPRRRYSSAEVLAEDLDRWRRREPILARPSGPLERAVKWARRRPAAAAVLGTVLVALLAIAGLSAILGLRISRESEKNRQQVVRLNVATGNHLSMEGDPALGCLYFLQALQFDRGSGAREEVHRRRIGAALRQAPRLERLWRHAAAVNATTFSRDGSSILTASDDGSARLWDCANDTGSKLILRHPAAVSTAFFGPDGQRVATTCSDNFARVWDVGSHALVGSPVPDNELEFKRPMTPGMALSNDGQRALSASGPIATLWDVVTGKPVVPPLAHRARVLHGAFSPDGTRILTVCDNGEARLWNSATAEPLPAVWKLPTTKRDAWSGGWFSSDGRKVLVASGSGLARIWDAETGAALSPVLVHPSGTRFVQGGFSPDGKWIFTAGLDNEVRLWHSDDGRPFGTPLESDPELSTVHISPDSQLAVLANYSGTALVRRSADGKLAGPVLHQAGFVFSAQFSPNGEEVVTGSQAGLVQVWHWRDNLARQQFPHSGAIVSADFGVTGSTLMTASSDGTLRWWDASTGNLTGAPVNTGSEILHAAFNPARTRLAVGCVDCRARLWDASGREVCPPMLHEAAVRHVAFNRDGSKLLTITMSGSPPISAARLWDAITGLPLGAPIPHPTWLDWCEFSPDGERFLTACADGYVRVYDSRTGHRLGTPMHCGGFIWEAHFSPDGQSIAAANADYTYEARSAFLFASETGAQLLELKGHQDGVTQIVFTPDGRRLVTGGEDSAVRIWDAHTGAALTPALRHRGKITRVAVSPDGRFVATASWDGTARVWDAATGDPITAPLNHGRPVRTLAFSPNGLELLSAGDDGVAYLWDLSPADGSLEELNARAQLISAHRLDVAGTLTLLTADELDALWRKTHFRAQTAPGP